MDPQIGPQDLGLRAPLWTGWVRCKNQVPLFLAMKSFLHRLPKPGLTEAGAGLRSALELAFCPGSHTDRHPVGQVYTHLVLCFKMWPPCYIQGFIDSSKKIFFC